MLSEAPKEFMGHYAQRSIWWKILTSTVEIEGKAKARGTSIGRNAPSTQGKGLIWLGEQCRDTKIQTTKLKLLVATLQAGSQARKRPAPA